MDSKELGLVIIQQLTGIQDLHYGYWDENAKPTILEFTTAQKRYSDGIISSISEVLGTATNARILDVGCGTGGILVQLLQRGYQVDGVIPAAYLKEQLDKRLQQIHTSYVPKIYECLFEKYPETDSSARYDLVFFSESFQYVLIEQCFMKLKSILKKQGKVLICDFFKSIHHDDQGVGDKCIGGGHDINIFYKLIEDYNFNILKDSDITKNLSPNMELIDEILMQRVYPATRIIDKYLVREHPIIQKGLKLIFRKKINKINLKYFSGLRNKQVFEKYKTYRLVILENC